MQRIADFIFFVATLAACETVDGLSREIEAGGEAIWDTVDEVQAQT